MRKLLWITATLSFIACALQVSANTPPPTQWAIVVGVNNYQRATVTDLKYAVPDAALFAQTLIDVVGVPKNQVFTYTTDQKVSTEQPRLTNLVYRLEWLKDKVKPQDTIYFYFAGHGVETEGETFLLMDNADNRSKATLSMSTLNATLLFDLLDACKAKDTLVILDACRNDPAAGRGSEDNPMTEEMSRGLIFKPAPPTEAKIRQRATLFACAVGERSYEWADKGHGYFTYFLVKGLKAGAAGPNGSITLGNLSSYVRKEVATASSQAGEHQQPSLRYDGPGPEGWILAQRSAQTFSGQNSTSSPADLEARLQEALKENTRLRQENAELRSRIQIQQVSPSPSH